MRRFPLIICLLVMASVAVAQQPRKVTDKYFPDPAIDIPTPAFSKTKGYTTHKEMIAYIEALRTAHPDQMKVEVVGRTQKGRDIPLVTISSGGQGKIRMLYTGRVHGDEPSGTEALLWFIKELLEDPEMHNLLDRIDFYIMPMVNADGAESFQRPTANGIDLNRDQSKLDSPEAQVMSAVATRIAPQVYADFHEYQPVRSDFDGIADGRLISTPWDVMLLWSGNPNVPLALRSEVSEVYVPNATKVLDDNKLTHTTYYTSRNEHGVVTITVGGSSARSTSNAMALRGAVSLLIETRGIKLDRTSLKRRVWTAWLAAKSFASTTYENADAVKELVDKAIPDAGEVAVKFAGERKQGVPFPFIDLLTGEKVSVPINAQYSLRSKVTLARQCPESYYILPSQTRAAEKLGLLGIGFTRLEKPETLEVEAFTITELSPETDQVGGVIPVAVSTTMATKSITFPQGTIVVPTAQRNGRLAVTVLEPECSNGFAYFRVIDAVPEAEFPVYRYLKK